MAVKSFPTFTFLLLVCLTVIIGCKPEDNDPENYQITYVVEGGDLDIINFHSKQSNFDIPNVPNIHWSAANVLLGGDTISLYGHQLGGDSLHPIIVTLTVAHSGYPTVIHSDTGITEGRVTVYLPF